MTDEDRTRILELTGLTVGGSAEHVLLLSRRLDPRRYSVTVAFPPGGPLDDAFHEAALDVRPVGRLRARKISRQALAGGGGALSALSRFAAIYRLIRSGNFSVVHTHTSVDGALGRVAAKLAGVPITVHMIHAYAAHDYVAGPKRFLFRQAEKLLDRFTTFYVAGSSAIEEKGIANGIMSRDKIQRIFYGLDLQRFDSIARHGQNGFRESFGIPLEVPLLGLIGRLEPQKGVDFLIDAAPRILDAVPDAHFAIIGDGSLRVGLERDVIERGLAGRFHFTGWWDEVPVAMHALEILLSPSRWEAFGIVNIEAMAAAKPVVGFEIEGIPEVVADGETGFIVEAGDTEALATATIRLLQDRALRARMGAAGRRRVEELFSAERMVEEHDRLLQRLIGDR